MDIIESIKNSAELARLAGCNVVLTPDEFDAVLQEIEKLRFELDATHKYAAGLREELDIEEERKMVGR